jgi:hypothetical protein
MTNHSLKIGERPIQKNMKKPIIQVAYHERTILIDILVLCFAT